MLNPLQEDRLVDSTLEQSAPSADASRVLEILLADKRRNNDLLDPERVDSLIEKRSLDAQERIWVYTKLDMSSRVEALQDDTLGLIDITEDDEESEIDLEHSDQDKTESTESPESIYIDHVRHLLNVTKSIRLLTPEEEKGLARSIRNGELLKQALEKKEIPFDSEVEAAIARAFNSETKMILANLRLVVSIASKYTKYTSLSQADLVQDGIIGLIKAAKKFDPNMDAKFSTYATWWIKSFVSRSMHDKSNTIRIPAYMGEKIYKLRKTIRKLEAANGEKATIPKLAEELAWDVDETISVHAFSQIEVLSSDEILGDDEGSSRLSYLANTLPTPEKIFETSQLSEILNDMIDGLPIREANIIRKRFGFASETDDIQTLHTIGIEYGITRERIRQLEKKALDRLRRPSLIKRLAPYKKNW